MAKYLLNFLIFLITTASFSQVDNNQIENDRIGSSILDDTTKQFYGPFTTFFQLEDDIRFNIQKTYDIDTLINNFHRYQFISQTKNLFQDLGNNGTAMKSIYPTLSENIGLKLGFDLYDNYFKKPNQILMYDTKSPYSRFYIIWGGQGRSVTDVEFSRNIDYRSNFSFHYQAVSTDKQIEKKRRGDRNVLGVNYGLQGNYHTKNKKYFITGKFERNRQKVYEYGGVKLEEGQDFVDYFEDNRKGSFDDVQTGELRTNLHTYQEYKANGGFQFFHIMDRYKQWNDFTKTDLSDEESETRYFRKIEMDSVPVRDKTEIVTFQNEFGMKGNLSKWYYSLSYKIRKVDVNYKYIRTDTLPFQNNVYENYVGMDLRTDSLLNHKINFKFDYQLTGNYFASLFFKNNVFFVSMYSTQFLPTAVQQAYLGRHNKWGNSFNPITNFKIDGGVGMKNNYFELNASTNFNTFRNYVYFKENLPKEGEVGLSIRPIQESNEIFMTTFEVNLKHHFFKYFSIEASSIYAVLSDRAKRVLQIPELFFNAQLSYSNMFFNNNLELHTGIDYHQKSSYHANGYDPSAMQFYFQESFILNSFPLIDIFVNMKIKRGRFFFKLNNVFELIKGSGYFLTPYYPAQKTVLDFGIDFMLFD